MQYVSGRICGLVLAVMFAAGSVDATEIPAIGPVNDALILAKKPAKTLSEYGLFKDSRGRIPADRLLPFELNNPLFTDYAEKFRFIYVPKGAAAAPYQTGRALAFPVGSVLVKSFAYPASFKNPSADLRYIETRLLIHKKAGWKAYPYVWNEDQTEAYLKVAGKRLEIPVEWPDGRRGNVDYAVPNVNQCKGCHTNAQKQFTPIGPKVRNLNKMFPYPGGNENQITQLRTVGYLTGGPDNVSELPRVPDPFDPDDGDLFSRARSYLDGNCAHCHSPGRPADTSGLYLDYGEAREVNWGVDKPPVAAGRGSGGLEVDIKPGEPDRSILLYRMNSADPGIMMPELGRSMIHREGVDLIEKFIESLD